MATEQQVVTTEASKDLEQHVNKEYNRLLSPFAEDLTADERKEQQEKYGRVIFAPCGCISLEEFAREQEREQSIIKLTDKLAKARGVTQVYKNRYIKIDEENTRLKQLKTLMNNS